MVKSGQAETKTPNSFSYADFEILNRLFHLLNREDAYKFLCRINGEN